MPFFVKVGEKEVSFEDLPLSVWAEVERDLRASGVERGWLVVYGAPGEYVVGAASLIKAAAKHLGEELPEELTARHVVKAFRWEREDSLPSTWEEGIPSQEAAPTTG